LLDDAIEGLETPSRIRLLLRRGGTIELETSSLTVPAPTSVLSLCVDLEPVDSSEPTLFHKTTDRARYEERTRRHPAVDDVVLVNERGEVTETTRANLAVRLDGRWCTPPLDCGLLPGVQRARDLADGRLVERVITVEDLRQAHYVATLSSLRGWRAARVVRTCACALA
jgi:para-aminobenzoate synthetase/4-amino-4-deoxychorismate lyase